MISTWWKSRQGREGGGGGEEGEERHKSSGAGEEWRVMPVADFSETEY